MKISRHDSASVYRIRAYQPGRLTINQEELATSVVITPETLNSQLTAERLAELTLEQLEEVLAWEPETLLLGTGDEQQFPPRELIRGVISRGIGIEAMTTPAASRTFNLLANEQRRVAAILFVRP